MGQPTNDLEQQKNMQGATIKRVKQGQYGWDIEEIEPPGISVKKLASLFWAVAIFGFLSFGVLFGCAIPLTIFGANKSVLIPMFMFGSGAIVVIGMVADSTVVAPGRTGRARKQSATPNQPTSGA